MGLALRFCDSLRALLLREFPAKQQGCRRQLSVVGQSWHIAAGHRTGFSRARLLCQADAEIYLGAECPAEAARIFSMDDFAGCLHRRARRCARPLVETFYEGVR